MKQPSLALAALAATLLAACDSGSRSAAADGDILALQTKIATLEQRKERVAATHDILRLQGAYGYYVDKALWDDAADLFADDGTIEMGLDGVYLGKARVRDYLHALGGDRIGLGEGRLNEWFQVMPVITLAADGKTAKARWRAIVLQGSLGGDAFWSEGPYENEYVNDGGVWKIKALHWYPALHVPYAGGWQTNPDPTGGHYVAAKLPPDRPPTVEYKTWPDTYLPPFSFPNPVARYVQADAPPAASGGAQ